jgi:hypothetical protein
MSVAALDLSRGPRSDAELLVFGTLLAVLLAAVTLLGALERPADPSRAVCRQPTPLMMGYFLLH